MTDLSKSLDIAGSGACILTFASLAFFFGLAVFIAGCVFALIITGCIAFLWARNILFGASA